MKIIIAIFVISSLSWAKGMEFLSHAEFKTLPKEKQIEYVKGLQKIITGMAEKTPYMAEVAQKNGRRPANDEADAEGMNLKPVAAPTPPVNVMEEKDPTKALPVESATPTSPAIQSAKVPAAPASAASGAAADTAKQAIAPAATASAPNRASTEKPEKVEPKVEKRKVETEILTESNPKKPASADERNYYACMYGGFVIEAPPCRGYNELPESYKSLGLSEENSSCPSDHVVCNPLIFGLKLPENCASLSNEKCKAQAKVLCGPKAGYKPTWYCKRDSQGGGRPRPVQVASLIIETHKDLYQDYTKKFHDLCDKDQIETNKFIINRKNESSKQSALQDLRDTCSWANEQIEALNKQVQIRADSKAGQATPHSVTHDGKKDTGAAEK